MVNQCLGPCKSHRVDMFCHLAKCFVCGVECRPRGHHVVNDKNPRAAAAIPCRLIKSKRVAYIPHAAGTIKARLRSGLTHTTETSWKIGNIPITDQAGML